MNGVPSQIIVTPKYTRSNQNLFKNTISFPLLQVVKGSVTNYHLSGVATVDVSKSACNTHLFTKNQL